MSRTLATTSESTGGKVTYSFPLEGTSCGNKFRTPNNHNPDAMVPHMRREPDNKYLYKTGSYIVFKCKPGAQVLTDLPLYTYCKPDGTWSRVADCEFTPPTVSTTEQTSTTSVSVTEVATTKVKQTYSFPTSGLSCPNKFRLPLNYNESGVEFHVKREHDNKYLYKTGSYIVFHCQNGYLANMDSTLVTHCQPDGHWSHGLYLRNIRLCNFSSFLKQ